jgi:DNA replication protein DnaC
MNTSITLQQLKDLKLTGMARHYESVLQLPLHQQPEPHELIAGITDAELQSQTHYKTHLYLKLSKLRYQAMIEELTYGKERNLSKEQVSQLRDCSYIDRAENILISGATGSGKSFVACAFGHQACVMGYKTLYLNLNRFIEKITLLILDDFGLTPLDQNTRLALLQILEDRYGKKSVVIASQLPVAKWHESIAEPTLADAIMDRLLANAHRLELKGESLRKKSKSKN